MNAKTLCKQCKKCEEFTYQRALSHGKRKGHLFKFKYCAGNADIVRIGNWGPDLGTLKSGKKVEYVCSTKRHNGRARHFEYFLKRDKSNVILHLSDSHDLRMKKLREVSKACASQTIVGKNSKFPGVTLHHYYKDGDKERWMARVKIKGKDEYIGLCDTELEAAHAYYSKLEELGMDINRETPAYKTYQNWLNLKKFAESEFISLMETVQNYSSSLPGNVDPRWVDELLPKLYKKFNS